MSDTEVELQRIGSYIITRLLKNDTTSSLYLGKLRKKDIVIKVFHTPLITLEAKEAFLLRAKQLKKLKDRQIAELHDAGFIQDVDNNAGDQGYLVMQYVPGETLRQRVPPGQRIPADEVKRRLSPIASALHYAHVSNILLNIDFPVIDSLVTTSLEAALSVIMIIYIIAALFNLEPFPCADCSLRRLPWAFLSRR